MPKVKSFFIQTKEGIKKIYPEKSFEVNGQTFCIHANTEGGLATWVCSHYLSGFSLCGSNSIAAVERLAREKLANAPSYNYDTLPRTNSDSFILGYNALKEFVSGQEDDRDIFKGIIQACWEIGLNKNY